MIYQVKITETAEHEIKDAFLWLQKESPTRAQKWLDEIQIAIQSLSQLPLRCSIAPENKIFHQEVRRLLFGKYPGIYRILFFIQEDIVYVSHVRHRARRPLENWD